MSEVRGVYLSDSALPTEPSSGIRLLESALSRGISQGAEETIPTDITDRFSTEDASVFSSVKIGPVYGTHTVAWKWYSPDGSLYVDHDEPIIPETEGGDHWAWSSILIKGHDAEDMPGDWRLDLTLDGSPLLTEKFHLVEPVDAGTALGASLNIDSAASPIKAASGNSNNAALVVSVTDLNGKAVSGLGISNFKVDVTTEAPEGARVDIKHASEASRAPGFYIVQIVPTTYQGTQYTWTAGVYFFSVMVEEGNDWGQTVVPMDLCSPCSASGAGEPSEISEVIKDLAEALALTTGTALGASLNIDGVASPINAASGNSNNAVLVVSVTDQNGKAVSGLDISNFKVDATIVAPFGSLVDIKRVSEASGTPGFYIVEIVPTTYQGTQYTWTAGVYLFSVTVERGNDRGQTVVPMDLCSP